MRFRSRQLATAPGVVLRAVAKPRLPPRLSISAVSMAALSQIVGVNASPFYHNLCVARDFPAWQSVGVPDASDKNGGPNNLRAWREYRKLSQEALAVKVGTTANMIQYLETGERGLSLKWLRRLAPALNTTVGNLAEHDPENIDMEAHDIFTAKLSPEERRQLLKVARALIDKTGTNGP